MVIVDELDDNFIDNETSEVKYAECSSKFLGQVIDSRGLVSVELNKSVFGNVMNVLNSNPNLSRVARMKLFKGHMPNRLNYLLPLLTIRVKRELKISISKYKIYRLDLTKMNISARKEGGKEK